MRYTASQILALEKSGRKKFSSKQLQKAATDLGRKGGLAGGPARFLALTYKQTMTIARHAAYMRWYDECPVPCPYCRNERSFIKL